MYSADSLEYYIDRLFRDGIGEHGYTETDINELLNGVYYDTLLQAVRHNAQTVYAYTLQDNAPKSFCYRGGDLFGQRATLLYEDYDQGCAGIGLTARTYELWLLEDMSLAVTACVSVDCADGALITEYRQIKEGNPWDSGMSLDLEELAGKLTELCAECFEGNIPVYEL